MSERRYEQEAADFCDAIRRFAENEDALNNMESYLTYCFADWLRRYANTPESLAGEMRNFAAIYD